MGMSAPISEALIVYAELTQIRPSQHLQPTVISVITGTIQIRTTFRARRVVERHNPFLRCPDPGGIRDRIDAQEYRMAARVLVAHIRQRCLQHIRQLRHDDVSGVHAAIHGSAPQGPHVGGGERDEERSYRDEVGAGSLRKIRKVLSNHLTPFSLQNTNTAPRGYRHMRHHRHGGVFYFLHKFAVCNLPLYICILVFRPGESPSKQ